MPCKIIVEALYIPLKELVQKLGIKTRSTMFETGVGVGVIVGVNDEVLVGVCVGV
jgi:hypothetical protein